MPSIDAADDPSLSNLITPSLSLPLFQEPQGRKLSESSTFTFSSARSLDSNLSSGGHLLLPIPNPGSNKSQSSFAPSDDENQNMMLDSLPEEIANADISIAHDGSFIETSSGAAARELKKRYDEHLGVGNTSHSGFTISPFAITAFVNQHGRQMYRVGHRELSPPALSAAEDAERQIFRHKHATQSVNQSPSKVSSHRRRSRMSMHTFLPPSLFKHGNNTLSKMPPMTNENITSPPLKKLRKTRSMTNIFGIAASMPPQTQGASTLGRPHAHSVTGVDVPQMPKEFLNEVDTYSRAPPNRDIFSDVMQWSSEDPLHHIAASASTDYIDSPSIIRHPFGHKVSFDSPSYKPRNGNLATPPVLREMHSFESGLTARADMEPGDSNTGQANCTPRLTSEELMVPTLLTSPQSQPPQSQPPQSQPPQSQPPSFRTTMEIRASPSMETIMHSRYSTGVFDVLQQYRGLPLLDKLSQTSNETTVIRLSTRSETSAAPKDDPRFVIWGEIHSSDEDVFDTVSLSHESQTNRSSYSGRSRQGIKGKGISSSTDLPIKVRVTTNDSPQKALVAATIERWIAQLTSELNYDELLVFFLTYRTYVSAVDLCHLLICRFHWAVEQSRSVHHDMVKKIVRVRTFIAIRYWLLTFFTVDFVPNRELRVLFANWLNTLCKDPTLENTKDVLDIVRKLKKVAKECKDAQTTKGRSPSVVRSSPPLRKPASDDDSDVDLDFLPDGGSGYSGPHSFGVSSSKPMSQSADMAILQQPLQLAILQHSKPSMDAKTNGPFVPSPATLPFHRGALSRAFFNTVGRLGRWKRVLNSRSNMQVAEPPTDVSPFDLEPNATGDLLTVRGGVEQYLRIIEAQLPKSSSAGVSPRSSLASPISHPTTPSTDNSATHAINDVESSDVESPVRDLKLSEPLHAVSEEAEEELDSQFAPVLEELLPSFSRSISPRSYDSELSRRQAIDSLVKPGSYQDQEHGRLGWELDIVSIDELELSDMSSDGAHEASPGLRRVPRRLPLRRDFEFVRRSVETISSFAGKTRDSVASVASDSAASSASPEFELGTCIQQWQLSALVDSLSDDEEAGDVDAALRRLEGRISHGKQIVKKSKVDSWVKSIRERMITGAGCDDEQSRVVSDDEETSEYDGRELGVLNRISPTYHRHSKSSVTSRSEGPQSASPTLNDDSASANQSLNGTRSEKGSPVITADAKPLIEDAVPMEILQSRVFSRPSTSTSGDSISGIPAPKFSTLVRSPSSVFIGREKIPRIHRSSVWGNRAGVLADHFAIIERELFMSLKFEELVVDDWMRSVEESNVLDWAQFLKDRARYKAEARGGPKTSALVAFRGRFNLCANFVVSEIILTHPSERHIIISKLIRLAWKLYERGSFNTLIAIIAGLRSEWVTRAAKKSWNRVGTWENRMLRDLIVVTSPADDFRFLRQEVEAAIEAKPILVGPHDTSSIGTDGQSPPTNRKISGDGRVQPRASCIPFLGIYLAQLYRHSQLPDLVDPTAPNEPVGIDPVTNAFEAPVNPDAFSTLAPLPSWIQLEPLINVQKQRLIAGVIKSLVTGQHLASKMQFSIDKKLFQRCLKLKALDEDTLQRAHAMYSE